MNHKDFTHQENLTMDSLSIANEQFKRKLERERRLHAIEVAYQDVVSDAQQKHDSVYNTVFNEAAEIDPAIILEMQHLAQHRIDEQNNKKHFFKRFFRRNVPVVPFVVQSGQSAASPPAIATSDLVVKNNEPLKDGKKSHFASSKFMRKHKKTILIVFVSVVVVLAIGLTIAVADLKELSPSLKTKMRLIETVLVDQKINIAPLSTKGSPQYEAMLWLAKEMESGKVQYKNLEKETKLEMDDEGQIKSINEAYGEKRELLERFVLVTLYQSTTCTKRWLREDKWLEEGLSVCSGWFGVDCAVIPKEGPQVSVVTNLKLSANKMVGKIPNELEHLSALTQLHLDRNALTGTLPDTIGNLASLSSLRINENNLLGVVPDSVCKLKDDGELEIASNCGGGSGKIECSCCSACL